MKKTMVCFIIFATFFSCEKLEKWRKENALKRMTPKRPEQKDIDEWKRNLALTEAEIAELDRNIRRLVKKTKMAGALSWRIARAFVRMGNYELGVQYYTEALIENAGEAPDSSKASLHKFESALPYFNKALLYRPLNEALLFETGLAYANAARDKGWERKRREMAVTIFQQLIRKNPEDTRYPYQLALIYFDSSVTDAIIEGLEPRGYNDQDKAFQLLDSILKKEPDSIPVRFAKANFLYRIGETNMAKNEYLNIKNKIENMERRGKIGNIENNQSYKNVKRNLEKIEEKTNF